MSISKLSILILCLTLVSCNITDKKETKIVLSNLWKFNQGASLMYPSITYNDSSWELIRLDSTFLMKNRDLNDTTWYRMHVKIPSSLKVTGYDKNFIKFNFSQIIGSDQFYLNGELIGENDDSNTKSGGVYSRFSKNYYISIASPLIKWDSDNLLVLRVVDKTGNAGSISNLNYFSMKELKDDLYININDFYKLTGNDDINKFLKIKSLNAEQEINGRLELKCTDVLSGKTMYQNNADLKLLPHGEYDQHIPLTYNTNPVSVRIIIRDKISNYKVEIHDTLKYVLTE